jgi:hypothetical protein
MVKGGDRLCGSIPDDKSSDVDADESDDEEQLSFGEAGQSNCSSLFDAVFAWSYSGGRHDGSLWILRCSVSLNRCNRSSQLCWNSCRSLIKLISALWLVKVYNQVKFISKIICVTYEEQPYFSSARCRSHQCYL